MGVLEECVESLQDMKKLNSEEEYNYFIASLSDTVTLLICSRYHQNLTVKSRAIKISRVSKLIRDRTKSKSLENACRTIISATQQGRYDKAVEAAELAELMYLEIMND